eukprot:g44416.t1
MCEAGVAEVAQSPWQWRLCNVRKSEKSAIPGVPVERGTDVFHKQVWPGLTTACLGQTCLCQKPASPPFQCLMGTSWQPSTRVESPTIGRITFYLYI